MTSTDVHTDSANSAMPGAGDMRLEVAILPVSDVDRAKAFYQKLGWSSERLRRGRAGSWHADVSAAYQLIRLPLPVTERRFEIEFLESGAAGFAFTFG